MKQYFIAICIVLLALSCSDESGKGAHPAPPAPPAEATLTVMIPGFRSATETRAGVHEEQISEVDVLLFRDVSGTERVAAMLQVPSTSISGAGTPGEARLTTSIPAGEYSRLALVVNAHTELTAAGITAGTSGSSYTDLRNVQTSGRYGNLGFGPDKTIAMYGEYAPTGGIQIEAGVPKVFPGTVGLIRSMARVDFVNQETSPDFVPLAVNFVNVAENGAVYVSPAAYGVDLDAGSGGSGYLSPMLPASGLTPAPGSQVGSSGNTVIEWYTQAHTYYLYEQPASGSSALSYLGITRPRMVLKANYKGRETWYPIDFTWDGVKGGGAAPYTKGTPMPILRNHRYIFTIKEAKGPGYATWEEAFTTPEMLTNQSSPLTIETHVIDEAYTDVTFNNQGFLAVSRRSIMLKGAHTAASTENKVEVLTNVVGGFRVQNFNSDGTKVPAGGWLTPSIVGGPANANTTVQAITNGRGIKGGYLEVRAGRLYTKVNVEQFVTPLELVAEYNLAGGAQYGASFASSNPAGASPTSAQTDTPLRWATSHANDQSGYYNWYVAAGRYHFRYNSGPYKKLFNDSFFTTGEGKGYHLPSAAELVGIFSSYDFDTHACAQYGAPTGGAQTSKELCEFGGIKKVYLSTYFSTGDGVCYGIRFKAAPNSTYQGATDNHACCAFRYTRVGTFVSDNNLDSQLKIDCVYLGEAGASLMPQDIGNDAWWNARASETVTRIFPAAGSLYVDESYYWPNELVNRGAKGYFWSSGFNYNTTAWYGGFESIKSNAGIGYPGYIGLTVRPFTNE